MSMLSVDFKSCFLPACQSLNCVKHGWRGDFSKANVITCIMDGLVLDDTLGWKQRPSARLHSTFATRLWGSRPHCLCEWRASVSPWLSGWGRTRVFAVDVAANQVRCCPSAPCRLITGRGGIRHLRHIKSLVDAVFVCVCAGHYSPLLNWVRRKV